MRHLLTTLPLAVLAASTVRHALHVRPDATPAQLARAADDSTLLSYTVDSIRVIQRLTPATGVVAVNVYLLGGSRQLTPATQGIEAMLLTASRYGTRTHPDTTFRIAWAGTGSFVATDITSDWTMLGFRGVPSAFDASFDLIGERLTQPTFGEVGVTAARERLRSALRQQRGSPDGEASLVADSVAFAGHPYSLSPYGSEASLGTIDSLAMSQYVQAQVVRSRMLVVVAGAASRAMVEAAVRRAFGGLPVGGYRWTPPPPAPPHKVTVTMLPRTAATNYLIGVFDGPPETSSDYPSFAAATSYLGLRITEAVREKRGLSYAASASVSDRAAVTGVLYVSTSRPDTVLRLIKEQIAFVTNPDSMPPGYSFTSDKNSLSNLSRRATSSAQVDALAHAEILQGDYRLANEQPRRMRTVSTSSVRRAAVTYMKNIRFIYAGDTTQVKRAAFESKR
ncbi:MAG: insulinase family protein [Gemmatimonadota bacterium]